MIQIRSLRSQDSGFDTLASLAIFARTTSFIFFSEKRKAKSEKRKAKSEKRKAKSENENENENENPERLDFSWGKEKKENPERSGFLAEREIFCRAN